MSRDVFMVGEQYRFGPFAAGNYSVTLDGAAADFAAKAGGGLIRVRGRHSPAFYDRQSEAADTRDLTDNQLRDFARYDLSHGGLVFGTGWVKHGDQVNSRRDGWREVQVSRADLMREFPPVEATAAKGGRPPEVDWDEMKLLAEAALKEHPDIRRSKLADSLVAEYAAKINKDAPVKRTVERKLASWNMGATKPVSS